MKNTQNTSSAEDKMREYRKQYYAKNKEKMNASTRRWQHANKDRMREIYAKYVKSKPEAVRAAARRRYARLQSSVARHTNDEALELFLTQKGLCALCQCELKMGEREKDHVTPLARGGSDAIENIQWLCVPCNRRKSAS